MMCRLHDSAFGIARNGPGGDGNRADRDVCKSMTESESSS